MLDLRPTLLSSIVLLFLLCTSLCAPTTTSPSSSSWKYRLLGQPKPGSTAPTKGRIIQVTNVELELTNRETVNVPGTDFQAIVLKQNKNDLVLGLLILPNPSPHPVGVEPAAVPPPTSGQSSSHRPGSPSPTTSEISDPFDDKHGVHATRGFEDPQSSVDRFKKDLTEITIGKNDFQGDLVFKYLVGARLVLARVTTKGQATNVISVSDKKTKSSIADEFMKMLTKKQDKPPPTTWLPPAGVPLIFR